MNLHAFANPARFLRLCDRLMPALWVLAVLLIACGLPLALVYSPADYQQGDSVRIMYVHVPAAWMSMAIYMVMAAASACFLIWKHTLADVCARACAPIGAAFTALTLFTGSLWGKPMWGAWWVWDARLTSELILLFLYIGYIALDGSYATPERGRKACAMLALVGAVNIPVIRFSVEWWNTLHQPASIIRPGGPAVDPSMLTPLLLMGGGFTMFFAAMLLLRIKTALLEQKIRRLQFFGRSAI